LGVDNSEAEDEDGERGDDGEAEDDTPDDFL
jgi:hypothetical protein